MNVENRVKEAEIYRSMGLLEESLMIYEEIEGFLPESDTRNLDKIKKRIRRIKQEHDSLRAHTSRISEKDISIIKEAVSGGEGENAMLDNAVAFKQLGLMKEAALEYEKLLKTEHPLFEILPDYLECLMKGVYPEEAIERASSVINEKKLNDQEQAQFHFSLGLQLEDAGHRDIALVQFKKASVLDPQNRDIQQKLKAKGSSVTPGSRYSYLLKQRIVSLSQLQQALAISKKARKSVEFVLIDHFKIDRETIGKSLSEFYTRPFLGFDPDLPVPVEIISNLKKPFLLHAGWVPLKWGKNGLEILIDDPKDLRKVDQISGLLKANRIEFFVGIREDIEQYIDHFFSNQPEKDEEEAFQDLEMLSFVNFEEEEEDEEEYDGSELFDESSSKIVKLIDQIIVTAYRNSASDIHIEPSVVTKKIQIRFRTDGVCQNYIDVPISMARGLLSRVKIMAGLDIAEKRLPQDGKIKFKRKGVTPFELRLATLPVAGGFESAVLRILAAPGAMKIDEMGLSERNLTVLKRIIKQPYGLILAAGPTGSGKTTTLHASLAAINQPGVKIWTAEDPVEITQQGLSQVEVKPKIGLTFARVMRSFLRADPDVIMIGEMRDHETASIALEASLTGHLVFSTLHTNSAPETVTRLLDMGLNTLNFSDAFLGVLAQRLIRKLCPKCRKAYHPTKEEFDKIAADYGLKAFKKTGIDYSEDLTLYSAAGCDECAQSGYKGRVVIQELMEGTPRVKQLIKDRATVETLFEQAADDGMTTLKQDGIQKVFQGLTDINEVRRVCMN